MLFFTQYQAKDYSTTPKKWGACNKQVGMHLVFISVTKQKHELKPGNMKKKLLKEQVGMVLALVLPAILATLVLFAIVSITT